MINPDPTVVYEDVQTRKPSFAWPIVLALAIGAWALFIAQIGLGRPVGGRPASDVVVWFIWIGAGLFAPLFVWLIRLTITVSAQAVTVRYRPFITRRYPVEQIASVEPMTYRPMRDWVGWGIRLRPGVGWCYTISGNQGVMLILRDGRKRLLGATDAGALAAAIERQL